MSDIPFTVSCPMTRFSRDGSVSAEIDIVAKESQFRIVVNGSEFAVASILPDQQREFTLGFLKAVGMIQKLGDARSIEIDTERGAAFVEINVDAPKLDYASEPLTLNSACGNEPITVSTHHLNALSSELTVAATLINSAIKELVQDSQLFRETGGVHSVAIYGADGTCLAKADDIGRHNAFDKVVGGTMLNEPFSYDQCFVVCTGRLTSEIVTKCWRSGFPVLISRSCATSRAIEIAADAGITLVGFARGGRCNVYCHAARITGEESDVPS